ncbi:SpoVR family protein [Schlesneria paludicola]|uniref:SpoVR family protein n=1 Tax=Schlesneria paludicola TaxID=360056 RepID=UPI000299E725|nr:SpoVR family protein [Schlesneria paludicola]
MTISTARTLPPQLRDIQLQMEALAKSYGLDFFETIFEVLDLEELCMFAAYGGFPVRYPHWRFGAEYDQLLKTHMYGLQRIYEMVINNDPCYAYLLNTNEMVDQKLVIAHVYGHCDFFKNNAWFGQTNRKMLDQMANHATRVSQYVDRYGYEKVEEFIDACLSLEDLIDMHSMHIKRAPDVNPLPHAALLREDDFEYMQTGRLPSKGYMDSFINPPEVLEKAAREKHQQEEDREKKRSFPDEPQRDVLLFLLEHAPLRDWQHDILAIVRDEAYYFAPQGQTKIMNEGWASYWHTTLMTKHGLTDAEVIDYADHHSGTVAMSPQRINPYKIGIELYRDIEERWNRGQFGAEYDECDNWQVKQAWDKQLGLGRKKIFEVRRIHNDITFIDTFLTPEFCKKHKMFSFAFNDSSENYEIASRQFQEVKQQLLNSLTNHSRPFIYVVDANHRNRGELYLQHSFQGIELKQDYAQDTLRNLHKLWARPVHLETVIDDKPAIISFDGTNHLVKNK